MELIDILSGVLIASDSKYYSVNCIDMVQGFLLAVLFFDQLYLMSLIGGQRGSVLSIIGVNSYFNIYTFLKFACGDCV